MKKITYSTERELESIRHLATCYDFALSLMISLALSELDTCVVRIRTYSMFRHDVKRCINNAVREADMKRAELADLMTSRGFFETYADRVIDVAENDVSRFRSSLCRVMERHSIENTELYAQMETTRCLLEACVLDYGNIAKDARERFGVDMSSHFVEYDMRKVFGWFSRATQALYGDVGGKDANINLSTSATTRAWNTLHRKITNGEYIEECMKTAQMEHPEFLNTQKS